MGWAPLTAGMWKGSLHGMGSPDHVHVEGLTEWDGLPSPSACGRARCMGWASLTACMWMGPLYWRGSTEYVSAVASIFSPADSSSIMCE